MKTRLPSPNALGLLIVMTFFSTFLNAQVEVAHLTSRGFSATGFGGFLNFGVPVTEGSSVTAEAGVYYFKHDDDHIVLVPFLLGYRHTLNGTGTGFYIEPTAGYSIGGTDIPKTNANGGVLGDGNGGWLEQKAKGITAGMSTGYIFPGAIAFNIALRYQHVFVSNDPTLNLFSIRLSHPLSFRRREY